MRLPLLVATAATALVIPATAQASLHSCSVKATNTATISSSRDMSCATAAKEMRAYRGEISKTFKTPGGFVCNRVSGGQFGGQWRCVNGHKAFRFEFAD
jgi:hypothetical protein